MTDVDVSLEHFKAIVFPKGLLLFATVDLGCLAKHERFLNLVGGSSLREGPSTGPIEGNAGLGSLRFNKTTTIQCKRVSLCQCSCAIQEADYFEKGQLILRHNCFVELDL